MDIFQKYNDKTAIFIGPGPSVNDIDISIEKSKSDAVLTLNDGIMYHDSTFYFIGEKYIFNYVRKSCSPTRLKNAKIVMMGLPFKHKERIDLSYYNKFKNNMDITFIPAQKTIKNRISYNLPLVGEFSDKNMGVLSDLLNNFPIGRADYIRSRTLANSLQVCFNLGFKEIKLIGFMDSLEFSRNNMDHHKVYLNNCLKENSNIRDPKKIPIGERRASFLYQTQILRTIKYVYEQNGKILRFLSPKVNLW